MQSEIDAPKEVLIYEDNDGEIDGRTSIRVFYGCPRCGHSYLMPYENRCPECEQALRWTR